jgi:hypothetical protein
MLLLLLLRLILKHLRLVMLVLLRLFWCGEAMRCGVRLVGLLLMDCLLVVVLLQLHGRTPMLLLLLLLPCECL